MTAIPFLSSIPLDMTMWSCFTSILYSCPSFPEPWTGFLLLQIQSRNTWQRYDCHLVSVSWLSPTVIGSLVLCCSKLWAYSSTIFNALVWSTEFPFMVKLVTNFPFLGVKCHICHICHTLFLSQCHGHTLVLLWSTSFGIGPFLEYQFWVWSQPGVLNLALVPAWSTYFGNLM